MSDAEKSNVSTEAATPDLPLGVERAVGKNDGERGTNLVGVDDRLLNLTSEERTHLDILQMQLEEEELTLKGYNVKRSKVLQPHVRRVLVAGGKLEELKRPNATATVEVREGADMRNSTQGDKVTEMNEAYQDRKLLWTDFLDEEDSPGDKPATMLDAFGRSLLFVNRLYSRAYGHARREVPAHIPHFVDR